LQFEQRLAEAAASGAVVRPLELTWQSRYQLGAALSPMNVSSVLRRADYGDVAPLQDLLSEVRQKHPKLHAALQIREQGVLSLSWSVRPYQKPARKVASKPGKGPVKPKPRGPLRRHVEVAKACDDMLKNLAFLPMCEEPAGGYKQALGHLLGGVYRGFAAAETLRKKDPKTGRVVPWALSGIASRRFRFVKASKLVLDDHGQHGPDGLDVFGKYPGRFVSHRPRITGEEPHREGLGRALLFHLCFAIWSWRERMQFSELFGRPWVWMEPESGVDMGPEDVTKSEQIVDTIGRTKRAVTPAGFKLHVEWPTATGGQTTSPSASIIVDADEAIILGVLGQQASMGAVQNGLGGGGDVRDLIRRDLLEADAMALAEVVTRQLFAPFVAANWGQDEPVPEFVPDLTQTPDAVALTKAFATGAALNMRIGRDWAQEQLGWPVAGDDEPILGAPAPKTPADPAEPDSGGDAEDDDAPDEGDSEEEDEAA
jgi:phage gp29-like protein